MKKVHLDLCVRDRNDDKLVQKVAKVLGEDKFNVELFGMKDIYSDDFPQNGEIVDYGSRETLILFRHGIIIDDKFEIDEILENEAIENGLEVCL